MKIISTLTLILILCLTGCKSTHVIEADAETFLSYTNQIGMMTSISTTEFIGVTGTKAYIEHTSWFSKEPDTYIYWIQLSDLPVSEAQKIIKHQEPWIPYDHSKVRPKPQQVDWNTADLFAAPPE
ncbi:hypothetical protein P4E94_19120 [Pontiellaceae bacterium B12219]|nr:hypothetical protein [Pontiellaceae bacterium B12219]